MTKSFTIIVSCIFVAGCAAGRKSVVWQQVIDSPRVTRGKGNASEAYSAALHSTLQKARVPHKVVTYNYPYRSKFDGAGTAQRTSVIYRDASSPEYPWWLMDERLTRPVWLPSESVQRQVSFFLRRPAKVVTLREYSVDSGKSVAPIERIAPSVAAKVDQRVAVDSAPSEPVERRPWMVARVWKRVVSYFRPNRTQPEVRQEEFRQPVAVQIAKVKPVKPVEVVSEPAPLVAEGPKRPLFRPSGAKLRPFFSSF